jgi:4-hydroxythreonine-4-phosphate dehydrogenase
MEDVKIKVGITQGDFNGIGYEVIIKTLLDNRILEMCAPVVYGSPKVAAYHRKALNIPNFSFNIIKRPEEAQEKRANMINCLDDEIRVELGKLSEQAGQAAVTCLKAAVNDLKEGKIHVLVTGPINKQNTHSEAFHFAGHTEYLEHIFNTPGMMFMVSEVIRLGLVTGHVPVSQISQMLSIDLILAKLRIMNQSLIRDFTIRRPRIAILGLNPHAGDEGLLGTEDKEIILPAVRKANEENILVFGPFPADGFFGSGQFSKFDATLAMYHDQGLAPFKTIVFNQGVNYTAGLPVVRTSPSHGTAFDIAGANLASPDSFRNAMYLACDIYRSRMLYKELTRNPLPKYDVSGESKEQGE